MTTLAGGPEEVPFLSGMERKGDEPRDDLQADVERLGRDVFSAHGMVEKLKQTVTEFVTYIRGMRSDRYVDPDEPVEDEDLARIVRIVAKYGGNRHEYHEAPRGDDNGVKTIILGVGATLLCAFVGGGWILSNRVAALEARVTEWQVAVNQRQNAADQRIERLENRRP